MNLRIQKIKLRDLIDFVESEFYHKLPHKPISKARAHSYNNNPNGKPEDIVLYMAVDNNQMLVGYRTILSDVFYANGKAIRLGWFSGNWVHPHHRRKGISSFLFNEVYKDWEGKLVYSNYAEASKRLYDKTGKFEALRSIAGYRYYYRSCLGELLPPKSIFFRYITPLLTTIDHFNNLFLKLFAKKNGTKTDTHSITRITDWSDLNLINYINLAKQKELFRRDVQTYQWIENYPWIKTDLETKKLSDRYQFSSYAEKFSSNFYQIHNTQTNEAIGFFQMIIRDHHLKIPYMYSSPEGIETIIYFLKEAIEKNKIRYFTIYDKELNLALQQQKFYLQQKPFTQNFFITKKLAVQFSNIRTMAIQSGDGDSVFS